MKKEIARIFFIFLFSFFLNLVWENAHSFLYAHYQGGIITEFILLRASLVDAIIILFLLLPFLYNSFLEKHSWLIIIFGIVIAMGIEWHALNTGRWAYNELMPIIPFTQFGLTPTIQLGLLGFISYQLQKKIL